MYSGTSGRLFKADLYIGMVYYQRLRHMVSDKYQVYPFFIQKIWFKKISDTNNIFLI